MKAVVFVDMLCGGGDFSGGEEPFDMEENQRPVDVDRINTLMACNLGRSVVFYLDCDPSSLSNSMSLSLLIVVDVVVVVGKK